MHNNPECSITCSWFWQQTYSYFISTVFKCPRMSVGEVNLVTVSSLSLLLSKEECFDETERGYL